MGGCLGYSLRPAHCPETSVHPSLQGACEQVLDSEGQLLPESRPAGAGLHPVLCGRFPPFCRPSPTLSADHCHFQGTSDGHSPHAPTGHHLASSSPWGLFSSSWSCTWNPGLSLRGCCLIPPPPPTSGNTNAVYIVNFELHMEVDSSQCPGSSLRAAWPPGAPRRRKGEQTASQDSGHGEGPCPQPTGRGAWPSSHPHDPNTCDVLQSTEESSKEQLVTFVPDTEAGVRTHHAASVPFLASPD